MATVTISRNYAVDFDNTNYPVPEPPATEEDYLTVRNSATSKYVYENGAGLAPRQAVAGSDEGFWVRRTALYFDTSSLEGFSITSAILRVYLTGQSSGGGNTVQNGQPTYPHNPGVAGDFSLSHYSGDGGKIPYGLSAGWYNIELTEDGISWINTTGETRLIIRSDNDINAVIPIHTGGDGYGLDNSPTYYSPKLVIIYEEVEIAVTTQVVSQKAYKCAMGNGTVVSGTNITERGFEVKLAFSGTLNEYVEHSIAGFVGDVTLVGTSWVGTLVKTESETGTYAIGAYELVLGYPSVLGNPSYIFSDRLFACEAYTYRARATIDGVVYYGDWVAFTTLCYPVGHQDDDTPPIYIPPFVPPEEPIEPIEPFVFPEFPPLVYPEMPDGYGSGMFYYRKAYTKKDLDELRRKCRIFLDNSVEYALVLNHNMRVLQQFLNMMHIYLDVGEFNGFKDLIPTQHLNALAHEELNVSDFKAIINNFISNSVNNTMNVNNNFRLIRNGLTDYLTSEDTGFMEEKVATRIVKVSDPDVEMLKKKVDELSREMASNYATTQHNLYVTRSMIL